MRRITVVSLLALVALGGCATELPSSVPLGSGPLAGEPVVTSGAPRGDLGAASQRGESDDENTDESATGDDGVDAAVQGPSDTKLKTAEAKPADVKPADAGAKGESQAPRSEIAGRYSGNDFTLFHYSNGSPDLRAEDPNAKTDVAETKDGIDITVLDSSKLVPMCTLHAKLDGNKTHATIDPGQTCNLGLETKIQSGIADFSGKHLHFEVKVDIDTDSDQGRVRGDGEYRFDGDRQ